MFNNSKLSIAKRNLGSNRHTLEMLLTELLYAVMDVYEVPGLTLDEIVELYRTAKATQKKGRPIISKLRVGAAVKFGDFDAFGGSNNENSAFIPSSCVEQCSSKYATEWTC